MFKKNKKIAGLMKRQLALVLSIVMALSCFATAGIGFSSVFGAPNINDWGYSLTDSAVALVDSNPTYVEGANSATEMDSKSFVTQALENAYGHTMAYVVDNDGNPILVDGEKQYVDIATATPASLDNINGALRMDGTGFHTIFDIVALTEAEHDITRGEFDYSSFVSRAGKNKGSIVYFEGKYAIALGHYDNKDRFVNEYAEFYDIADETNFNELANNYGEMFVETDIRYWFGKTLFAYAQDEVNGIAINNIHTPGDATTEGMFVLQARPDPSTIDFIIEVLDSHNAPVEGVTYEIYVDEACTTLATVTGSNPATSDDQGEIRFNSEALPAYYLKQTAVPAGYVLSDEIIKVTPHGKNDLVEKIYLVSDKKTVHVQVVDRHDMARLIPTANVILEEWDEANGEYKYITPLTYNKYSQTFTLASEYTNVEGTLIQSRQLVYTDNNLGKFRVRQQYCQNGYSVPIEYQTNGIEINMNTLSPDAAILMKNQAVFALNIKSEYPDHTPMAGSQFEIKYPTDPEVSYVANNSTDDTGMTVINNSEAGILDLGPSRFPVLYQTGTLEDGYIPQAVYTTGYTFNFDKDPDKIENGMFVTTLVVPVQVDPDYVPFQYGQIDINKNDNTMVVNPGNHGIKDAVFGVYTDADCTVFAEDIDGNVLNNVITDANGNASVKVNEGTYYIKEIGTVAGYATNNQVKVATFDKSQANHENNGIVVESVRFGTYKQTVSIGVKVKDSASNKALSGASLKLYASEDITSPTTGQIIKANTLLGYYETDADGVVIATTIGSGATAKHEAYYPLDKDGVPVDDDAYLPNAHYYFVLDEAVDGYVYDTDAKVEINAEYVLNETDSDVDGEGYTVTASGRILTVDVKDFNITRQTGKITFSIKDADVTHPSDYYDIGDATYNALADAKLVASLNGAVVHLYTASDVIDITTGEVIPANTFVGLYHLENGAVVIDKFTAAGYADSAIPNGDYKLKLDIASVGYIVENDEITVSLAYDETKTEVAATASIDEIVVKQHVSVKSKSDSDEPVAGAKYDIYSVAKIIDTLGIDKADLPWILDGSTLITADVLALVEGEVAPEETITSGDDGIATTTNKLVFGEYIIVPHKTPGFGVPESVYIRIPAEGGDFILPPLDTVEFEIVSAEKKFTVSATTNFDYPAGINDIPVVKKGDEVTYTFKVVNTGSTAVDNIVINIPVPAGMTYVTSKLGDGVNGQFWLNDDIIAGIDSIEVGGAATVEVTFAVDAQVAAVYTTTATYGRFEEAPVALPVLPETAATVSTPVLQSIGFEKSADYEDGVVSVGDEITYTFKISAPHMIYYVLLTDELPDGVTFVENSLEAKIADEEWENISEESLYEVEDGVFALYCGTLGEVDCFVRFKVKVNNIAVNSDNEFVNKADLMYEQNRIDDENIEFATITSNEVSHIVDIKVSESEIGVSKPTFIGKVGEKSDITVLKDGDEYSYSVPVKNEGTSSIKNLVIKTKIADKAEFVEADLDGKYDKETGEVVWIVPEVKPGEEIKVTVKCKVATNNEAAELVNDVFYAFANDVNAVKADEWIQLDSVIYQTIKAELSASVGGNTADEAASVKIGDKITYTGKFTILNKVYGFSFTDTLPKGITYVDGTLTFVDAEGKAIEVKVSVNEGVITIEAIDLEAGVYTVTFDVTVDDVAEADKTFVYENKLEVSVKENKTSDEKVNVGTNAIFVKTIKETPKLGAEVANKTFVWTLISIISAISSIALAAYYFIDKKRSIKA